MFFLLSLLFFWGGTLFFCQNQKTCFMGLVGQGFEGILFGVGVEETNCFGGFRFNPLPGVSSKMAGCGGVGACMRARAHGRACVSGCVG